MHLQNGAAEICIQVFDYCDDSVDRANGSFAPSNEIDEIGRKISPRSSPPTTKGEGRERPLRKQREKKARRYRLRTSFHPVLHGGDVTACPARDRGTRRRRWRKLTCARLREVGGGGTGEEGGDGAGD